MIFTFAVGKLETSCIPLYKICILYFKSTFTLLGFDSFLGKNAVEMRAVF